MLEMVFLASIVIIMVACIVGLAWNLWMMACNERCAKQRQLLIEALYTEAGWRRRDWHDAYARVSYEAHIKALGWRRDPWVLYPADLADAAKRGARPWFERLETRH